jgi:aspartate 1-decarboxylase
MDIQIHVTGEAEADDIKAIFEDTVRAARTIGATVDGSLTIDGETTDAADVVEIEAADVTEDDDA